MRNLRILIASLLVVGTVAASASVASGGALPVLPVQITKVIEGTPPPGAQFVVEVTCGDSQLEQVVFDGAGSQIVPIPEDTTCTFTETNAGGASQTTTSAECAVEAEFCTVEVTSATSATVALLPPDGSLFEAEVTFTNSFVPPPPEPAPLALEVTPAFTG